MPPFSLFRKSEISKTSTREPAFRAVAYERMRESRVVPGTTRARDSMEGRGRGQGVAKKTAYELWVDETRRRMER